MEQKKYNYICNKCNYGTNIEQSLINHFKTKKHRTGLYGGKKKEFYECNLCEYSSTNKNNYLTHKLNNHANDEERESQFTFYCKTCKVGVFTESSMKIHKETIKHQKLIKILE